MRNLTVLCAVIVLAASCTPSTYTAKGPVPGPSYTREQPTVSYGEPGAPSRREGKSSFSHQAPATNSESSESAPRPSQAPEDRPGLGTVWGETRTSPVEHRHFDRATPYPTSTHAIYYNDEQGLRAQMEYREAYGMAPVYSYLLNGGITVTLKNQSGQVLVGRRVNDRTYVVGQAGDRYSLIFTNQTSGRFEVVASVDGLDVIDGRPANPGKRGYILNPHSTLEIDGFRRSDQDVAAFRFGRVQDSYAAKTTGDRNVGVIGLAFFQEKGSLWTPEELQRRDSADPFPGRYATPPSSY